MIKFENDTLTIDGDNLERMAIEIVLLLSDIPEIINHIKLIDVFKDILVEEPENEDVKDIIKDLTTVNNATNRLKKSFASFFGQTELNEKEKVGGVKLND